MSWLLNSHQLVYKFVNQHISDKKCSIAKDVLIEIFFRGDKMLGIFTKNKKIINDYLEY